MAKVRLRETWAGMFVILNLVLAGWYVGAAAFVGNSLIAARNPSPIHPRSGLRHTMKYVMFDAVEVAFT